MDSSAWKLPSVSLTKEQTLALREKHIGPSCKLFFRSEPLKIVRASGCYMFDETGQRYLDCINNVSHVGHCHPQVVEAGVQQMRQLNTNNRFLHDNIVLYAQRLTSLLPESLSVCYFMNSGSEANDLAMRLARTHTKHHDVITLDHAYHGHLTTLIDISPYKFNHPGGEGQKDWVHMAPCPDSYRGKYTDRDFAASVLATKYADDVQSLCQKATQKGGGVSAFIAESMQSCGGQIIYPEGYLRQVYHVVSAKNATLVPAVRLFTLIASDTFELLEEFALLMKCRAIAESFAATGMEYFNTFGGNPVSCAIANAVLDVLEKENLREHALEIGNFLLAEFNRLKEKYPIIGDVRGQGMFLGLDLVKDRTTRDPATAEAAYLNKCLKEKHILLSNDGPHRNVLKFKSPIVFNKDDAVELISALDQVLTEMQQAELEYPPISSLVELLRQVGASF